LLERFELLELLGMGAFGEVYRARDHENPHTPLALKLLGRPSAHALYLFKREFRALSAWSHPNLVALHDLFLEGELAFFTMELVAGVDFMRHVRPGGVLDEARLRQALHELHRGVAALHAHGYVHRDLKPSNVLIEPSGRVVIVDLGLATLYGQVEGERSEQGFNGTINYAAPEQLVLGRVGPEADWYAVGTMLYEALRGSVPYDAPFADIYAAKLAPPSAPPSTSQRLSALSAACLALLVADPRQRAGADALLSALGHGAPQASTAAPREAELVGRRHELDTLRALFARVERGEPVVALVEGTSGVGKTTLVDSFLHELRAQHRALVLRGRCYINEELTYQAVDGCIDALSHHLRGLPSGQVAALLPRDVRSLARLFPVLNRVEAVALAPPVRALEAVEDKASLRERAAAALRELLARLSDRLPSVLFIDDVHWDDADSAWLLSTLLAAPEPPATLLVLTCRSEERAHSHLLRELSELPASARALTRISLPALSPAETLELVERSLFQLPADAALVERLALESGGHPLFAIELARFAADVQARGSAREQEQARSAPAQVSLDDALRSRAERVSAGARRLLELCCVAGRPVDIPVALTAAACEQEAWRELVQQRLVTAVMATAGDAEGTSTLSIVHDRVREAVLMGLPPEHVRALHGALAQALLRHEQRFELIVEHFLAANRRAEAARHALRAADQAMQVLAFHRLPALLQLATEAAPAEARGALNLRLAEAYALIGRGAEAARAYEDAAAQASTEDERWELGSLAMWQAFHAKDYARGEALLAQLDAAHGGRKLRPSLLRVLWVAWLALVWVLFGPPRLAPTRAAERPSETRRLRLAFRASMGLVRSRTMTAFYYAVWSVQLAARLGDPASYAPMLALFMAAKSLRSGRSSRSDEHHLELASELSQQADLGVRMIVATSRAAYFFSTAQHERAERELWPLTEAEFPPTPLGTFLYSTVLYAMSAPLLFMAGRVAKAQQLAARAIAHAHEGEDTHLEHGLRTLLSYRYLASDDAELAWSEWARTRERYPEHEALRTATYGLLPALYAGRLDRAELVLSHSWRWLFRWEAYVETGRANYLFWWGAVAAARLAAGEHSLRLRARAWLARVLLSLNTPPLFVPYLNSLRAAHALRHGRRARALQHLSAAHAAFEAHGVRLCAAAAALALAQLHPDPAQQQHFAESARSVFEAEKIERPERWLRALLPGLLDVEQGAAP
jgi:hypothetical protein